MRFLRHGDKVKVTIMFRGREQAHPERGRALLERLYEDIEELATIDQAPQQEGRNMHMMLGPTRQAIAKPAEQSAPAADAAPAEANAEAAPAESEPAAEAESGDEPAAAA